MAPSVLRVGTQVMINLTYTPTFEFITTTTFATPDSLYTKPQTLVTAVCLYHCENQEWFLYGISALPTNISSYILVYSDVKMIPNLCTHIHGVHT